MSAAQHFAGLREATDDEMDLAQSGQYRTLPDGSPFEPTISFWPGEGGDTKRSITELVETYWEAVGIQTVIREVERSFLQIIRQNGEFDATLWHTDQMSDPL